MKYIDLHVHTTYSDGMFTPKEAVIYAKKVGLAAVGITDHDSTSAIDEAIEEAQKHDIEIIPGIELSGGIGKHQEKEVHILGYFIDWKDAEFQEKIKLFRQTRFTRAHAILEKLKTLNIRLDPQEIFKNAELGSIGRLHFAKALLNQGFVQTSNEAFAKYLGNGKPAYVPKHRLTPEEAINMIFRVGGIPVLAHPYIGKLYVRSVLNDLVAAGLQGIEVWHVKHPPLVVQNFTSLTQKMGLIPTGGSDCHGELHDGTALMGKIKVPYKILQNMRRHKALLEREKKRHV